MKDNWKEVPLGELVDIQKGKISEQSDYPIKGYMPIINTDVLRGDVKVWGKITGSVLCDENNVLILWDGERSGLCAIGYKGVLGSTFAKMNVSNELEPQYLYRFIDYNFDWIQGQRTGTGVPHVPKDLKTILKVEYPPLPQQRKIASILSNCDEVIEKTEAAIAKYQALKQGMMHDLFTRGIDIKTGKLRPSHQDAPELYKESDLGMIPKDWEVYRLDDLIEKYLDFRGKTPLKLGMNWGGGDIRALSANNVQMGAVNFDKECYYGSINLYNKWMNKGDCEKGDVLMTMEAPLGNVAQVPDDKKYILSQRTILLKNKREKLIKDFMYYLFCNNSFQSSLFINSTGSTVRGIQQKKLARIKVIIPKNIKEQNVVALKLKAVDGKINIEQSALTKYQQLKTGLMQDLLTGKVEVNVAEKIVKN